MSPTQIVIKLMMLGSYFARIKPYLKNNRRTNKLVLKRPPFSLFFQVRKNLRGFFPFDAKSYLGQEKRVCVVS